MKGLILLLCFPFLAATQTVHFNGKKILYEGTIKRKNISSANFPDVARYAIKSAVQEGNVLFTEVSENVVLAKCTISLNTSFQIIRQLHFNIKLTSVENNYAYRIDSVFITEQPRGGESVTITDKELLEGRELTGTAATTNEKLLNGIDMNMQKIISLLKRALQRLENKKPEG